MGSVALDSSVMVAWLNPHDAHHDTVVERLNSLRKAGDQIALPAVVFAELMTAKDRARRAQLREMADGLFAGTILPVNREVAELAGEMRRRSRSLRTPDALIAATSRAHGARYLLTTDRTLARLDGVKLVNASR